jgi:hypothetical protein
VQAAHDSRGVRQKSLGRPAELGVSTPSQEGRFSIVIALRQAEKFILADMVEERDDTRNRGRIRGQNSAGCLAFALDRG